MSSIEGPVRTGSGIDVTADGIPSATEAGVPLAAMPVDRGFLLDRLWSGYSGTDDRRRKSFYYLYSGMAIFVILWISREDAVELPFLKTNVSFVVAFSLAPSFLLVLTVRYLYLCAHSLLAFTTFLDHYSQAYSKQLRAIGVSYSVLFNLFKQRDFSEHLNCFLFPLRRSPNWDGSIPLWVKNISLALVNIGILFTVAVPISAYWLGAGWVAWESKPSLGVAIYWALLTFYAFGGVLVSAAPLYFYYRALPALVLIRKQALK